MSAGINASVQIYTAITGRGAEDRESTSTSLLICLELEAILGLCNALLLQKLSTSLHHLCHQFSSIFHVLHDAR